MANSETKQSEVWMPSLKWLLKVLLVIYVVIAVAFFVLNFLLKPYMRDIPKQLTPWLNSSDSQVVETQTQVQTQKTETENTTDK